MLRLTCVISLFFIVLMPVASSSQGTDDLLYRLNDNLRINFLAHLQSQGISVTNKLRAKIIGYILNRQAQYAGEFETDRILLRKLQDEAKDFIQTISPDEDLWPIVVDGIEGRHEQEIHALMGGSPYVEPIFTSLDRLLRDRDALNFDQQRYNSFQGKDQIMASAQEFLAAVKDKRFRDVLPIIAGHLGEEWPEILTEIEGDPKVQQFMNRYADNLEWELKSGELTDTSPPVARLIFNLYEYEDGWSEYDMILILDAGKWRIVRFEIL